MPMKAPSPFALAGAPMLGAGKFVDPVRTAKGEERAAVSFDRLDVLWFNTGTLCNLACQTCYIESSPTNDALIYLGEDDVRRYLDEIADIGLTTPEVGFTGGEPFMNKAMLPILRLCRERGFRVLILTNAMRPMRRFEAELIALEGRDWLTFRVSLDHYTQAVHEGERGQRTWETALDGLRWLARAGFRIAVAGRHFREEGEDEARAGYAALFASLTLPIDAYDPARLVLFPEMDATADVPEITTACWAVLDVDPQSMMCASSRMVVRRKGEAGTRVAACTLLPYDPGFDMGSALAEALIPVRLNHPHCARFCVLGGASCSA
jgi:uncharacterized Fe-S cluster-containing radical SAM superfamily protein